MIEVPGSGEIVHSDLTEAFRRVHFLDHVFPVSVNAELTRAQEFELSVTASGIPPEVIGPNRINGLLLSVDDYDAYLRGGVAELTFAEGFITHLIDRIHQARIMASPNN